MSKICSECSATLDADSVFCVECGTSIIQTIHCPKCGGTINAGVKFCKYCAFDLSQPIQKAATTTVSLPQADMITPQITTVPTTQTGSSQPAESAPDNPASFISPSGAAFVVICFFLPWLEWSACGIRKTATGAELSQFDGSFLLFPLAGIVCIVAYFIAKGQKKLWKARPFILISAGLGLFLLFYKVNSIPSGPEIFGQRISASDLGFKPQIGGIGTVIGFILAMIGCVFMSRQIATSDADIPNYSTSPPADFQSKISNLQPNKAAMWCYLSPLLLPIAIFILAIFIGSLGIGLGEILILLGFPSQFVTQIVFLNKEPHKRNLLVRFHAYQSLFIIGLTFAISILLMLILSSIKSPMSRETYAPMLTAVSWLFSLSYLGLVIFCAVKAYKGEIFKASILGDWAMNWANKINLPSQTISSNQMPSNPTQPTENYSPPPPIPTPDFASVSFTEKVDSTTNITEPPVAPFFETKETDASDKRLLYGIGGGLLGLIILIGIIVWATSSSGETPKANSNSPASNMAKGYVPATRLSTPASNIASNAAVISTDSRIGKTGWLITNLKMRSDPNKTARDIGTQYEGARVEILDVYSFETDEGISTWFKVRVLEYGTDTKTGLGYGSEGEDEGWMNSKYISVE